MIPPPASVESVARDENSARRGRIVVVEDAPRDLRKTAIHPEHWYPVARSRDLKAGKTLGVTFAGDAVALVRTQSGDVFALEDRCAHRQVPLHLGVVTGDRLQCSYHCWTYDRTGRCTNVPYLDRTKSSLPNGVRSYPCREAYGFVFIYPGEKNAEAADFPVVPAVEDPAYKTRVLDRRIRCHYSFMHENLMDMNHQFLHRRWMGGIQTIFLGVREGDRWIDADYTFRRPKGRGTLGESFIIQRKDAYTDDKRDLMTIRTEYPYQTLRFWPAGAEHPALWLWNIYVPLDREQRENRTFGLLSVRRPSTPGIIHLLWPFIALFTERIFHEDRLIVEAEQRAFDEQGADWNQEIFPVIQSLRGVLRRNGLPLET